MFFARQLYLLTGMKWFDLDLSTILGEFSREYFTFYVMGRITTQLTYCVTGLDSTDLIVLKLSVDLHVKLNPNKSNRRSTIYINTSPYKVGEYIST